MNPKLDGSATESVAAKYLENKGFQILRSNYRTRYGEIDLIGLEGNCLVFIEVKSSSSDRFGQPSLRVNDRKQLHLIKAASQYLSENDPQDNEVRFDVVSILSAPFDEWKIEHIRDAFRPEPQSQEPYPLAY